MKICALLVAAVSLVSLPAFAQTNAANKSSVGTLMRSISRHPPLKPPFGIGELPGRLRRERTSLSW